MLSNLQFLLRLLVLTTGVYGDRRPLHIGGFMPVSGIGFPVASAARPAINLAVELINNSSDILPDYELILDIYDTQHSAMVGLKRFFEMVNKTTPTIFMVGPAISPVSVHVCVAASSWNVVQVSFSTRSSVLEDRELYPYFYRTIPSDAMLNTLRHQFLRTFGWSRVAVIYEEYEGDLFYAGLPELVIKLKTDNISVLTFEKMDTTNYASTLETLKDLDARIIIVNIFFPTAKNFFCEAYRRGFYGGKYVWILPGWAGADWWLTNNTHPVYNCTSHQLTAAVAGHFVVNYMSTSDDTSVLGTTVKQFRDYMEQYPHRLYEYSMYAFDAMITIGHVLHAASRDRGLNLSEFTYDNQTFPAVFVEELQKIQLVGISGSVGFDDLGNRMGVSVLEQFQDGERKPIGRMEPNATVLELETTTQVIWKGKRKPRDGYQRMHTIRFLPLTSVVLISVPSAIGFLVTCAFIAFNIRFANLQCIKLSSPNMNNVVSVGCGIGYISVIMFGIDGRQLASKAVGIMCHARLFVLCVAYSLAFGALFFKTWRVHRIMANKRLEKITLKDRHLLAWIFGLVGLDVLFLAIWASVDPLKRQLAFLPLEVDSEDSDVILVPFIEKCTCEHQAYWLGAMLVYKGLLLLFGLFLAWGTRSIQVPALNDSKYIGMSVYNLAVICVVGVPVGFLINDEYFVGNYIISSVFIIVAVTITLCFVFVPKLHTVYHNPSGEVDLRFGTNQNTTNHFSMSGNGVDRRGGGGRGGGGGRPHDDLLTATATSGRVAPVTQAALQIAQQHRLEKMLAERDSQIVQLKHELISIRNVSDSAIGVESVI